MRKFLLATTALVATTGVAAADMAVSGSAEMGIYDSDLRTGDKVSDESGIRFFQDVDVTFTGSGTTDSGLAFGYAVDLDEGGGDAVGNNDAHGGVAIFLSSDFGTVTMGDTDGAMDWALTEAGNVGNPGTLADDETAHSGYNGSYLDGNHYDGQILRYDHSIADIGFAFSLEMDDDTAASGTNTGAGDPNAGLVNAGDKDADNPRPTIGDGSGGAMAISLGAKYALDIAGGSLGLGGGFQLGQDAQAATGTDDNSAEIFGGLALVPTEEYYDQQAFGVSAVYSGNAGYSVGLQFAQITITPSEDIPTAAANATPLAADSIQGRKATALTHFGLGGGYARGPISVHANFGSWSSDQDEAARAGHEVSRSGFGLAAGYSLGGGTSVKLGFAQSTPTETDADAIGRMSLGLAMSF